MLNGLDLFSGIGGITLALGRWVRPVAYCENDRYAQGVLLSRMADGSLPVAPIWDDVTTLRGSMLPAGIDIIYGGFPCQDISVAGLQRGLEGERSGLIREVWRLVDELRPGFIFLENVPAIVNGGMDRVLGALAERGYDARWLCLSAAELGACHLRNRWWLLAHTSLQTEYNEDGKDWTAPHRDDKRQLQPQRREQDVRRWPGHRGAAVDTDTNISRLEGWNCGELRERASEWTARTSSPQPANAEAVIREWGRGARTGCRRSANRLGWPTVAPLCGTDDGIQHRIHRIKCLGNAVVPQVAEEAFRRLLGV